MDLVLGLDFGGTKLAAGVVDIGEGRLIAAKHRLTEPGKGPDHAIAAMLAMAADVTSSAAVEAVGVAFGGHVSGDVVLRSLHVDGWENVPLCTRVRERIGAKIVVMDNDATATALGEWRFGAARGCRSVLFVTVSTGIGAGIVIDGRSYVGSGGLAGELGHIKVLMDGPRCSCGQRGCLEAVASGPSIVRSALQVLQSSKEASDLRGRAELSAKDISDAAHAGDSLAVRVLERAARYCGIGIANATNLLDVDCVVVGGGVSRSGAVWWGALEQAFAAAVLPWKPSIQLRRAHLTPHEGVWGAVAVAAQRLPGVTAGAGAWRA